MHSPSLRLRNHDNPAAMMACDENRYSYKYKSGYQSAAP